MDLSALGLQKSKINQFNNSDIYTISDIAHYFPRKYMDYSKLLQIKTAKDGEIGRIIAKVKKISWNPNAKMLKIQVNDGTASMDIIWFHTDYPSKILKENDDVVFAGTIKVSFWGKQMVNPLFSKNTKNYNCLFPIYRKISGMSDDYLKKTIGSALNVMPKEEFLDDETFNEFSLMKNYSAIRGLHQPPNMDVLEKSQYRMAFNSLFRYSFISSYINNKNGTYSSISINTANSVKPFLNSLPFELTDGDNSQLSTVRSIFKLWKKRDNSNVLIQGDVGCGKTMVAVLSSLIMAENGYSTVIMAPTNILATQHYEEFLKLFKGNSDVRPVLYVSGMKKKDSEAAINGIKDGTYNVIIGTHSVLSDKLSFKDLGLLIIDEEHRFGVEQRDKIIKNASVCPHCISMSATPIPRSLAISIYGSNTNVYTITKMPNGRKPVKTTYVSDISKAYNKIKSEIELGHQAYIVCPLIDESESDIMQGVISANERYQEVKDAIPSAKVGIISGKMKQKDIDAEIDKFKNGDYDILVSTTIVEVGVNVPNATVIVISNAERFGLATLHQLRGRVGRSSLESYCILESHDNENERLKTMVSTTDGFIIAKQDLVQRGSGDFIGTAQSGENKILALIMLNEGLFEKIQLRVNTILNNKTLLEKYKVHYGL